MKADVQRKLKFYGIIKAFSEGKLPDNKQIDDTLAYSLNHWPIPIEKLSPAGKELVSDCQDVIKTLRKMVLRNNQDEIIQNMLYDSYAGDYSPDGPKLDLSKNEAKDDATRAYESARTLASLFLTNSDVRKLVSDLGVVGRNLFATAAVEAATEVGPSQQELQAAMQGAPADQWTTAQGGTVGKNQTPTVNVAGQEYNPHDRPTDAIQTSDLAQAAGIQQPGVQQPGVQQQGIQQPGVQQHGIQQPGVQQLGTQQHGVQQQGIQQPGVQQHGIQQPGVQQLGTQQHGVQQHGIQQPGVQQHGIQQPGVQQPGVQQHGIQQPGVQQHGIQQDIQQLGAQQLGTQQQGIQQQGIQQHGIQQHGIQQHGIQQQGIHQQGIQQPGVQRGGVQAGGQQQQGFAQQGQRQDRNYNAQNYGGRSSNRRGNRRRYSSSSDDDDDDDDVDRAARRARLKAQHVLDQAFPEEARNQFIWRLKRVLVNIQGHKDYQNAMGFFLEMAEKYGGHAQSVAGHTGQQAQQAVDRNTPVSMLFTVLERFANNTSLARVRASVDQLYADANNDPELRQWWSQAYQYIRTVLLDEGYVLEDQCEREGRAIMDRGEYFFKDKYKGSWDNLWNELTAWLKEFDNDPLNKRLGDDFRRLTHDLLFDAEGNLKFKPELWNDIKTIIVPTLVKKTGYIPIPRAEYSDDKLDLVVDNLVLSGPNIFPNIFEYEGDHRWKWSPFDGAGDVSRHRMTITLSQIQADIRDVRFAFRKKSGFPKLSDHGFADVVLARNGITVTIELETPRHKASVFRVRNVNTHVDQLSFAIRGSKHDLLYKFIKGAATRAIKKAISAAVEKAITDSLETADNFLVDVRNTVEDTRGRDDVNTKEALAELFKRKQEEGQAETEQQLHRAESKAQERNSQFAVVTSPEKEILPDLNSGQTGQGSITNKFMAVEKQAGSGSSWRSPAFGIA